MDYWSRDNRWVVLVALLCMSVGAIAAFPIGYISQTNVWLGVALLPFAIFFTGPRRLNYVYLGVALVLCLIASWYGVKLFYFMGLGVFSIFVLESCFGRVNAIAIALVGLASPAFHQFATIIGFPIRLQLSTLAGELLRLAGFAVMVEGNNISLNATDFAVDEACMGLNMLSVSMLAAIFILSHYYRRNLGTLSIGFVALFFGIVFGLNLICNLLRIVMLVAFHILPGDPMHDIVGLMCLVTYVIVPTFFIAQWMVGKWAKSISLSWKSGLTQSSSFILLIVTIAVASLGFTIPKNRNVEEYSSAVINAGGLQKSILSDGIEKYAGGDVLIYVKPIPEFFSAEHTPLICWKGSGYTMEKIRTKSIDGTEIYQAILVKGKEKLYTAWWYSNGSTRTIDQLSWRMAMLKGDERFSLVNVTSWTETHLAKALNDQLPVNSSIVKRR